MKQLYQKALSRRQLSTLQTKQVVELKLIKNRAQWKTWFQTCRQRYLHQALSTKSSSGLTLIREFMRVISQATQAVGYTTLKRTSLTSSRSPRWPNFQPTVQELPQMRSFCVTSGPTNLPMKWASTIATWTSKTGTHSKDFRRLSSVERAYMIRTSLALQLIVRASFWRMQAFR